MSTCKEFKSRSIDLIEQNVTPQERDRLEKHRTQCASCQREFLELRRLYDVFNKDEVVLPENEYFEHVRTKVRQKTIPLRGSFIRKIAQVLVPAAMVAALILLVYRPEKTVEMRVPTTTLLQDRDVAGLSLQGVVTEELVNELSGVEEDVSPNIDELIDELSEQEQEDFVEYMVAKYGTGL